MKRYISAIIIVILLSCSERKQYDIYNVNINDLACNYKIDREDIKYEIIRRFSQCNINMSDDDIKKTVRYQNAKYLNIDEDREWHGGVEERNIILYEYNRYPLGEDVLFEIKRNYINCKKVILSIGRYNENSNIYKEIILHEIY